MKIETILNAMSKALVQCQRIDLKGYRFRKYNRQSVAFRDRIIRMDERQKMEIESLRSWVMALKIEYKKPKLTGYAGQTPGCWHRHSPEER